MSLYSIPNVITFGDFSDPLASRCAAAANKAFNLAIAREYGWVAARAFAHKAKDAARRCLWQTPQQIAEGVVPVSKSASATVTPKAIA